MDSLRRIRTSSMLSTWLSALFARRGIAETTSSSWEKDVATGTHAPHPDTSSQGPPRPKMRPGLLVLIRGEFFRAGYKHAEAKKAGGKDAAEVYQPCPNGSFPHTHQLQATASHMAMVHALRRNFNIHLVVHSYPMERQCWMALDWRGMRPRVTFHSPGLRYLQGGQAVMWLQALKVVRAQLNSAVALLVIRADAKLRNPLLHAHHLMRVHSVEPNALILPFPFALGDPSSLRVGKGFAKFACSSVARLYTRAPMVADILHWVPRELFASASAFYFGHDMLECRVATRRVAFLSDVPSDTNSRRCQNAVYELPNAHNAPTNTCPVPDLGAYAHSCGFVPSEACYHRRSSLGRHPACKLSVNADANLIPFIQSTNPRNASVSCALLAERTCGKRWADAGFACGVLTPNALGIVGHMISLDDLYNLGE